MKFAVVAEHFEELENTSKRLEMFEILSNLFRKTSNEDINKLIYICQERIKPAYEGVEIGMAERMLEKAIARATGTDIKKVKELYKKRGDLGLVAENFSGNHKSRLVKPKELTLSEVYNGFLKAAKVSGAGAVDKKISIIVELLSRANPKEAKYIARFVIGRLRLGIGDPTILDSLSKAKVGDRSLRKELEHAYNLCSDLGFVAKTFFEKGIKAIRKFKITPGRPIRMALAERLPSSEEIIKKIGKCAVEAKYDGFRLQCHKVGNKVSIFSRNLENMSEMFPDIVDEIRKMKPKEIIFEGEALTYNDATGELYPFQVTITRKRKYEIDKVSKELPLRMFVFALLYVDGVDYTKESYLKRREKIESLFKKGNILQPSAMIITDNPREMEKFFEEEVSAGLEGVMAKRLDAKYSAGARNYDWIKLKRSYKGELSDTIDVVIVGYLKGKGMRAKFGIGAVLAAVYDNKEDVFKSIAKVGSGFSEKQWVELRKMLDKISVKHRPARVVSEIEPDRWVEPKYVITVNADEITRSPLHTAGKTDKEDGFALRFPRAISFVRMDKNPEDANTVKEIKEMFNMQFEHN